MISIENPDGICINCKFRVFVYMGPNSCYDGNNQRKSNKSQLPDTDRIQSQAAFYLSLIL